MKLGVTALVALGLTGACAVTAPVADRTASTAAQGVQSQIAAATASWNDALVTKDTAALQAIVASDFVLTSDDGASPVTRDMWFRNLRNMTIAKIDVRLLDVRNEGKLAIAQMEGEWDVTFNGRRAAVPFKGADSWVFRDGRWQVFRRHLK